MRLGLYDAVILREIYGLLKMLGCSSFALNVAEKLVLNMHERFAGTEKGHSNMAKSWMFQQRG